MAKKLHKADSQESIRLLNGCWCTPFAIHPKNWDKAGAKPTCSWYIWYRFHDPKFSHLPKYNNGKLIVVKGGANYYRTLMAKRQVITTFLKDERSKIVEQGYNPITKKYMVPPPQPSDKFILPSTPFGDALQKAFERKICTPETKLNLKSVLKYVTLASKRLKHPETDISLYKTPVGDITKGHIKVLLEETGDIKREQWKTEARKGQKAYVDKWTGNNYNHHRKHLGMLLFELEQMDAIQYNFIERIATQKVVKKIRTVLDDNQRRLIYNTLRATNFRFWVLINIFYMAGCRRKELMRVKGKDVDLANQQFKAIVYKGKTPQEVYYTITNNALYFWEIAMKDCQSDQYVFGKGLVPADKPIDAWQITKRWRIHVKERFGVQADFYSLKHLNTTDISDLLGTEAAAEHNNESIRMVETVYDVNNLQRKHNQKRKVNTQLLPK